MQASLIKEDLGISPGFCITAALMPLILPLDWIGAMAAAGLIHELAHILAVRFCGGKILSVRMGTAGAVIETAPMEGYRQLVCILAGPLGGLLLLFFARLFPKLAVCALVQSLYNLLPLFPLDGGRAVRCVLELIAGEEKGERIFRVTQRVFCVLIGVFGIACAFAFRLGILPLLLLLALWGGQQPWKNRKIPCKPWLNRVQ